MNQWLKRAQDRKAERLNKNTHTKTEANPETVRAKFKDKFQSAAKANKKIAENKAKIIDHRSMVEISAQASYCPIYDDQAALDAGDLGGQDDVAFFKQKMLAALKMPKEVSKKLASEDIRFARQYERETGESLVEWNELSAAEMLRRVNGQRLEELKSQVMAQNPRCLGVPGSQIWGSQGYNQQTVSQYCHQQSHAPFAYNMTIGAGAVAIQSGTPIRFQPEQVAHHFIGDKQLAYNVVEVKSENTDNLWEKIKAVFKEKARHDKRLKNIEGQAAESETWFSPSVIDVFADIAAETYKQVSAKVDKICDTLPVCDTFTVNMSVPKDVIESGNFTFTTPPVDLMSDSMVGDGVVVAGNFMSLNDNTIGCHYSGDYNISIGGC